MDEKLSIYPIGHVKKTAEDPLGQEIIYGTWEEMQQELRQFIQCVRASAQRELELSLEDAEIEAMERLKGMALAKGLRPSNREIALDRAISSSDSGSEKVVIAYAEAYLAFLDGGDK